ncbi:haloacid dehalogenase [Clostridium thermosuccinogenes]|jgi:Cof subfamily protein (haloacid dehalogenase superfamily)|uniref:Haloacid dehalogenase n=1 Tax=Clostridium thermosuccinogenes TaxID=84032 RepID=A0A2K2FL62_9CLOT|nr:Cof-type HAD-IIB family hydrolase [Pseudoclostridium thermosuccinogenes]AUS98837.1 haloacid dehalogenase [Pseudoclostridium thermosuccinogenes]PNT97493.1 haloacid dehalogenase [Pseudoclostridium thermosuccinogenes]PNT99524.1 haloacid dehalogenase [Pseudoclostridium thermosuccinogenes]
MYKMIAIDLDGTLLNSEKKISSENKRFIKLAMDMGVKVVICSGRVYRGARMYAREIGSKDPVIACNGAVIKCADTGEILFNNPMSADDCAKVIDICRREGIYFHYYVGDTLYAEKMERSALSIWKRNKELPEEDRIDVQIADDLIKVLRDSGELPLKVIAICDDKERLAKARAEVERIGSVDVTSSGSNNFEVIKKGNNKGRALEILTERLGIKREELIAIGDNENDAPMIRYAGLGIAMGNAETFIKDMADFVTLTNEQNGVAAAIRRFITDRA